jgi:hypothetical protein
MKKEEKVFMFSYAYVWNKLKVFVDSICKGEALKWKANGPEYDPD